MKPKFSTIVVFGAVFCLNIVLQTFLINLQPAQISAAPADESKIKACTESEDKDKCNEGYNTGFKGSRDKKDLIDVCGKEPGAVRGANDEYKAKYAGCEAGFNFAKSNPQMEAPGAALASPNADSATKETEAQADCDIKLTSVLSWIACPIIDMGVNMSDKVFESFIKPMLENVPVSTNPNDGSYKAWSQFRLMANILLVGSLLAIVYSQARGPK